MIIIIYAYIYTLICIYIYICTCKLYIIDVYTCMIMHVCPDIISIWVWLHGLTKIGCLDCGPKVSQFRDVLSPIFGRNRRNSIVAGYEAIAASPTIPSSNLNPTVGLANIGDFVLILISRVKLAVTLCKMPSTPISPCISLRFDTLHG